MAPPFTKSVGGIGRFLMGMVLNDGLKAYTGAAYRELERIGHHTWRLCNYLSANHSISPPAVKDGE